MEFNKVKLEIADGVGTLVLNDPSMMNAISADMLEGLAQAMDAAEDPDNGLRCLIMTGEGRGFCAGANLQSRNDDAPKNRRPDGGSELETAYHPLLRRLRNLKMPFITAVNGPAAGVGMSFALMGDMILCGRSAFFLQAFRRVGLVPDGGSTWLLPRLVGVARAKELSLLAEKLPAEKALDWGLINRVYDDENLMAETQNMAKELAAGPTVSIGLIRNLYWESSDNSYEEQLNLERQSQKVAGATDDFKEGVKAFLEKRPAQFQGK